MPGRAGGPGPVAADNRLFVDAVIWIAKTGAPWRDLPERSGNWNSVWRREDRRCKTGVRERLNAVLGEADLEELQLDLVDFVVARILDQLGVDRELTMRWGTRY